MDDGLLTVSVVVKDFDSTEPSFRVRAFNDWRSADASKESLLVGEGELGMGGYIKVATATNPPYGATVYGLAIGKARAYPCISLSLDEASTLQELDWWRDGYGGNVARMMRPTVLEEPMVLAASMPSELLEMAKECQAPEGVEGFFAGWPRSPMWQAVRNQFVQKNPRCAACGGTRMLNVHHKKPFHLFPHLELDESNLIVLCEVPSHACHFVLGHACDWKAYNPFVEEDARQRLERIALRQY